MANLKDMAESRSTILNLSPGLVKIKPGLNVRQLDDSENREHIEFLKASISENGFLKAHPLTIFQEGDAVYVSDGHCRLTAVHELLDEGLEILTIPCIAEERGVNEQDRILRQTTSNSGKRLTMLEEAHNVARLQSFGMTLADIARRFGKSAGYISQLLDFKAAPVEVIKMVKQGKVSATFAAETMRDHKVNGEKILKDAVATATSQGAKKATKKHSAIHQPKPKITQLVELLRLARGRLSKSSNDVDVVLTKNIDKALETFDD